MLNKFRSPEKLVLPELPEGEFEQMIHLSGFGAEMKTQSAKLDELAVEKQLKPALKQQVIYIGIYFLIILLLNIVNELISHYFGAGIDLAFLALIVLWVMYHFRYKTLGPSAIQIGKEGIRYHWVNFLGKYSSPWVGWESVEYASAQDLIRRGITKYESQSINLKCNRVAIARSSKFFSWLTPQIVGKKNSSTELEFQIDLKPIVREQDLQHLLSALRYFLPEEKIDDTLDQFKQKDNLESFTSIWLKDFHSREDSPLTVSSHSESVLKEKYRIKERLAMGGQSTTLLAEVENFVFDEADKETEEQSSETHKFKLKDREKEKIVLKQITLPVGGGKEILTRALENVKREADMLNKLDHPQIVKCSDIFVEGRSAYIGLDYIDGKNLRRIVSENGPFSEEEVFEIAPKLLDILEYLHGLEPPVVHRDFTPANLIMDAAGQITLIDFNVAEQKESEETRNVAGKHNYIPPEQFRGKATIQSDIYAFGCCLYFLLTGEDPEPISTSHPKKFNDQFSEEVEQLVSVATDIDTGTRFKNVGEIKEKISSFKQID